MTATIENAQALPDEVMLFDEDNLFFDEHAEELTQRYPEEWVAIYRKEVIGHDASLDRLMDSLAQSDAPLGQVAVRRATRDQLLFL